MSSANMGSSYPYANEFQQNLDSWNTVTASSDRDPHLFRPKDVVTDFEGLFGWFGAMSSSQIVVFGDEGCGKTCMTRIMNEALLERAKHSQEDARPIICACFPHHESQKTAEILYSSVISKLLFQEKDLVRLYPRSFQDRGHLFEREQLEEFLSNAIPKTARDVVIIVDGFDGYDAQSQYQIHNCFNRLVQKNSNVKILLTSRPTEHATLMLADCASVSWTHDIDRDRNIIRHMIEQDLHYGLKDNVKEKVCAKFLSDYGGNLAWVSSVNEKLVQKSLFKFKHISRLVDEMNPNPPTPRHHALKFTIFGYQIELMRRTTQKEVPKSPNQNPEIP